MSSDRINEILSTMRQYHTAKITSTFSKEGNSLMRAVCIPSTSTLELTFLEERRIELYDCLAEAVKTVEI